MFVFPNSGKGRIQRDAETRQARKRSVRRKPPRFEYLEDRCLMSLQWNSTSLSLFGTSDGASVTPNGTFFASDGFNLDRLTDQGKTWTSVSGGATFAGGAISYAPSNPNTMLAGRGHGTIKSVDGGVNWFSEVDLNAGSPANAIAFQPDNELTIYAGVGIGWGLYKSTNGGATWTNPVSSRAVTAVAIDTSNTSVVYVGTGNYSSYTDGLMKTTDGGNTWSTILANTDVSSVVVDPSNTQRVYVGTTNGTVYGSQDGGATWSNLSGITIAAPVSALAFDPQNSSHIWAATSGQGLFYSGDRGATWGADNAGLTDLNVVALSVQPVAPYDVLAVTHGGKAFWAAIPPTVTPTVTSVSSVTPNPRSSSVSTVGVTFSEPIDLSTFDYRDLILNRNGAAVTLTSAVKTSLVSGATYQISGLDGVTGSVGSYVLTVNAGGVKDGAGNAGTGFASTSWNMQTVTPTLSWKSTSLGLFGTSDGASVTPNGDFFASDGFNLDRLTDQGKTWTSVSGSATFAGGAISYSPSDPNTMLAGRSHGTIKSVDGGATWFSEVDLNAGSGANAIAFQPDNELTVYAGVGYGWGLYKSTNGGSTWTNPLSSRAVTSIAIDPSNTNVVYVGTGKYSSYTDGLLKSTDGGTTWGTALANTDVSSVLVDPSNTQRVYVGTTAGTVLRSQDSGATWSNLSGTTISAPVSALAFDPQNSSHVWAATAGQGLYYSGDGGATWVADNAGLTDLNILALSVQPVAPYDVLAVTYGGKAFWASITSIVTPTVTNVSSVTPNPRNTPVSTVNVTFSEPIDLSTFDYHDLTLTRNGTTVTLTSDVITSLVSGSTYQIGGLTGCTGSDGNYVLTVNASAIKDLAGNTGTGSASTSWVMDATAPIVSSVTRLTPTTQLTNASSVVYHVAFSEHVNNVTVSDFTLVAVAGALTGESITSVSASSGTAIDVTVNTGTSGTGDLRLDVPSAGTTIQDDAGNLLATSYTAGQVYSVDHTPPTVSSVVRENPSGQYTSAASVVYRATFSESVDGVSAADFTLVNVGDTITGESIISVSASFGQTIDVTVSTGTRGRRRPSSGRSNPGRDDPRRRG